VPTYDYTCQSCGAGTTLISEISLRDASKLCSLCGGLLRRRFSVGHLQFRRSWDTHLNASTGTVVSNNRQFRDDLKRKSEAASEQLGFHHNFIPIEDPAQVGIDPARARDEARRTASYKAARRRHGLHSV